MTSQTTCTLRDFFLHSSIGDVSIDAFLLESLVARTRIECLSCDSCTNSKGVTLSERTTSILNTTFKVHFRVTRSGRAPLAERHEFFNRIATDECKLCIKHGRHVSWIQEESVATLPSWAFRVEGQKFAEEDIDKVSTAHGTTRVSRFGTFDHAYGKGANIVGCEIEKMGGIFHENRKTAMRSSMRCWRYIGLWGTKVLSRRADHP